MNIDYLNITVPETVAATVRDEVLEVIDYCGASSRTPELWRLGETGTVKISSKNGYTLVGLSGGSLATLRQHHQEAALLWVFAAQPHRVTKLDIAHDVIQPARPVLNSLWRRSRGTKGIKLTRKRLQPKHVSRVLRDSLYDDGSTGTVYLGRRTSEVYAKVYDKRNEILDRTGHDVGHDLVRYELSVTSKMGISLKDASEPAPLFWNFMASVLPPPPGTPPWVPGGQGYTMPERRKIMPAEKLKQVVSESPELDRWLKYADEVGPNGREYLLGLIQRRIMSPGTTGQPAPLEPGEEGESLEPGN